MLECQNFTYERQEPLNKTAFKQINLIYDLVTQRKLGPVL